MKGLILAASVLTLLWTPLALAQAGRTDCPQWRTAPCTQNTTRFELVQALAQRFGLLEAQVAKLDGQHQVLEEIQHGTAPMPRLAAAVKALSIRLGALEVAAGKPAGPVEVTGSLADRLDRLEARMAALVGP
ncbi:MAG: hypothetical protein RRB13_14750 [bacterium]|nr:hypothetical protein [bacterium]